MKFHTYIRIFLEDAPVLALKLVKRGWGCFRANVLWLCFKLPSCLFGITGTRPLCMKKQNLCFNYMQPQKVKFKYVQLNMKKVSYSLRILSSC